VVRHLAVGGGDVVDDTMAVGPDSAAEWRAPEALDMHAVRANATRRLNATRVMRRDYADGSGKSAVGLIGCTLMA
jgi:hypothetical protein